MENKNGSKKMNDAMKEHDKSHGQKATEERGSERSQHKAEAGEGKKKTAECGCKYF